MKAIWEVTGISEWEEKPLVMYGVMAVTTCCVIATVKRIR